MFKTLKMINTLNVTYGLVFAEIMSDNGAEFASRNNREEHPFEAMLLELGIKHRYTRPYRPQTNGKVERFWRTLDDDVIEGATFDNLDHFAKELFEYIDLLQQLPTPPGHRRGYPERNLLRRDLTIIPISELVNLHSNDGRRFNTKKARAIGAGLSHSTSV